MNNKTLNFILLAALGIGAGMLIFKDDKSQPFILPNPDEKEDKQKKEEELRNKFPLTPSANVNPLVKKLQQNIIDHAPNFIKSFIVDTGGADGVFGQGLRNALTGLGLPRDQISFDDYVLINKQLDDGFGFGDFFDNLF